MIELKQIGKSYGENAVLKGVNLRFAAQRLTAIIGPNGAGKSTLLMLMARLLAPSCGDIVLQGQRADDMSMRDYAKRVATLRQSPDFTLRLTVEELVAFGRFPWSHGTLTQDDLHIIEEAIAFLGLEQLRRAWLDELSGGQRQMAFLAMTIAQQTPCLLLDEPLNHLDIQHAVHIMRALRRLCDEQGRTVILVVHDINFAANYADDIVALKDGAVHSAGSVRDVIQNERLQALYGLDLEVTHSERGYLCNYFYPSGDLACLSFLARNTG